MFRRGFLPMVTVALLLAVGAIACGETEAKPAAPVVYPAPVYGYPQPLGSGYHYHGLETQSQPSISVSGQGTAAAPPDIARVRVSVDVKEPTAAEARDAGKAAMSSLLDTAGRFGVEGQDVTTVSFTINPVTRRDQESGEVQTLAYRLYNVSELTLRDVEQVGQLVDAVVSGGGDSVRISGITLSIDDASEMRRQAREAAMLDAQARAQQLADLAGVALGLPISISESSDFDPSGSLSKGVLVSPEGADGEVPVGELEVSASVYVVYSLVAQ